MLLNDNDGNDGKGKATNIFSCSCTVVVDNCDDNDGDSIDCNNVDDMGVSVDVDDAVVRRFLSLVRAVPANPRSTKEIYY
jgi:hypothetical protein